jgi:hypothetical protein
MANKAIFIAINVQSEADIMNKKEEKRPFQIRPIDTRHTFFQVPPFVIQVFDFETIPAHEEEQGHSHH